LALCYWLVDMKRWRRGWTMPILVFGMNAIAAYMFSELLASCLYLIRAPGSTLVLQPYIFQHVFAPIASPSNASLLYSLGFVFVCWLVMLVLYKKKIFLKV
jgi:predicted acyltransferase